MTSESSEYERTLVYQEQLSRRKAGFMLPEIVARMERTQDDVIRADYQGSFLISGPAGSGKTTLAFHRIAYLLQSPDTAAIFSQDNVIVFVQDENTRAYFSQLLPELGIHNVIVTTFATWAFERLKILDCTFVQRANGVDSMIDEYEFRKLTALRSVDDLSPIYGGVGGGLKVFEVLRSMYRFDPLGATRFEDQVRHRILDRYDLAILLQIEQRTFGFTKEEEYFEQKKNFSVKRHKQIVPLKYGLIVVDEVQNYLPEQIALLRSCIDETTRSMLYVGDLAQQIFLGTMQHWTDAGEDLSYDRKIVLDKVYRSTKQIMQYIRNLGFSVSVPEELRDGVEVEEVQCKSTIEELAWVQQSIARQDDGIQIGILSFSEEILHSFWETYSTQPRIHVLPVFQAQGVEFDVVYIVGIDRKIFVQHQSTALADLEVARQKIQKDLVYVALTRAMDKMFVIGKDSLKNCLV